MLAVAELLFKYAISMRMAPPGSTPTEYSFGRHTVTHDDLAVTPEQHQIGGALSEHVATYVLAVQLDRALADHVQDRFHCPDPDLRAAAWIARLLRNAFSHDPFKPAWKLYPECENQVYSVSDVIELRTAGRHGQRVQRMDYGGPLALLRLVEFSRRKLLAAREPERDAI